MQDVRLRTGTAVLLSLAAFMSLPGAGAAFLWWLLLSNRVTAVLRMHLLLPVFVLLAFFSGVLAFTGGDGVSYFCRMMVVILIGTWVWADQKPGEFLRLGAWLFGERAGFELGLVAEMGIQALHLLVRDFSQIRVAAALKGTGTGWRTLVPSGFVLVNGALLRAGQTAEILAVRGYRDGGTLCPRFVTTRGDLLRSAAAVCAFVISLVPVSAFFILVR